MGKYVDPEFVAKSYRPKSGTMSPGLLRARAQYRTRNAITGIALAAIGVGIYAYSISAVKQEDFGDIDAEARALQQKKAQEERAAMARTKEQEQKAMQAAADVVVAAIHEGRSVSDLGSLPPTSSSVPRVGLAPRGLLAKYLDQKFPSILDPERKTLIWGAPPVDSNGRTGGRV